MSPPVFHPVPQLVVAMTLVVFATVGCGREAPASDPEAIEEVIKRNAKAASVGDSKTYCALLTGKALGQLGGRSTRQGCERRQNELGRVSRDDAAEVSKLKIAGVKVHGDTAVARIDVEGESAPLKLMRVEGEWLISDIDPTGAGAEVDRGFEKAERSQETAKDLDCSSFRFDAAEWREAANDDSVGTPTRRQRLADALIKCRTLIGRSGDELTKVLGRPDNYVAEGNQRSWVTGIERNYIAVDDEHLVVGLDRNGAVRSVELTTD